MSDSDDAAETQPLIDLRTPHQLPGVENPFHVAATRQGVAPTRHALGRRRTRTKQPRR